MGKYHYIKNKDDADVTKDRQHWLGCSDLGTIMGMNPWKSQYTLWLEKTGQIEQEDISDKIQVRLGNKMEQVVAELFTEETGIILNRSTFSYQVEELPFLKGHIDRKCKIKGCKDFIGCEIKTTSSFNRTDFGSGDIVPAHWVQIQGYCLLCDAPYWYYAVVRDSKFFYLKVTRDDDFIENQLIPAVKDFWKHVQDGTPPEIDGSDSTSESIDFSRSEKDLRSDEQVTVLSKDVAHALKEADEIKAQIKTLTELVKTYENNAKVAMEDYQKATAGNYELSYKPISSMRLDSKKLKEEKPDIYNQYAKESVSNRFTYKLRKEK